MSPELAFINSIRDAMFALADSTLTFESGCSRHGPHKGWTERGLGRYRLFTAMGGVMDCVFAQAADDRKQVSIADLATAIRVGLATPAPDLFAPKEAFDAA